MATISVVIPTYNRSRSLRRCLISLLEQTYQHFEVVVVDDCSSEDIKAVVDQFAARLEIQYKRLDVNFGGPAKPRNIGISMSQSEYIAFLDSDDWWESEKLEKSVRVLESGADLVYHDAYIEKSHHNSVFRVAKVGRSVLKSRTLKSPCFDDLWNGGNGIINSSCCVRRTVVEQVGWISEDKELIAAEDFDYWLRVSKCTEKFEYIAEPLMVYSISADSISTLKKYVSYTSFLVEKYKNQVDQKARPNWVKVNMCLKGFVDGRLSIFDILSSAMELRSVNLMLRLFAMISGARQ
jgi:glycosyltransferase involved in cell wall biosynthesis